MELGKTRHGRTTQKLELKKKVHITEGSRVSCHNASLGGILKEYAKYIMKKLFYLLLIFIGVGCQTYTYEVHLTNGTHHLITTDTEAQAEQFVSEQEDSHGTLLIQKVKN